jgi:hypothetical protein
MAHDMVQNEEWVQRRKQKTQLEESRHMTDQERADAFLAAMGKL